MDDKTVDKCCSCMKVCCSSESDSTEGSGHKGKGNDKEKGVKDKVNDAVGKVEGFFKNAGSTISKGVEDGWDKVKKTADDVKETGNENYFICQLGN